MRMEPPPSEAWAMVSMPEATADDAPPLEPPALREGSSGLAHGPNRAGSVVVDRPNSGLLVRPTSTKPAAL